MFFKKFSDQFNNNNMKKIFLTASLFFTTLGFSQVIIGDNVGSATNKNSVLLDFANTNDKGIVLPYVTADLTATANYTGGTLILDASNPTDARVKFYNGTSWVDLSKQSGDVTSALTIQPKTIPEATSKGAIIGSKTTSANGVLVLESTTKAMVLPQVNSTDDISNPAPGMMVYVNKAGAKRLAVYNGAEWSYWKY